MFELLTFYFRRKVGHKHFSNNLHTETIFCRLRSPKPARLCFWPFISEGKMTTSIFQIIFTQKPPFVGSVHQNPIDHVICLYSLSVCLLIFPNTNWPLKQIIWGVGICLSKRDGKDNHAHAILQRTLRYGFINVHFFNNKTSELIHTNGWTDCNKNNLWMTMRTSTLHISMLY